MTPERWERVKEIVEAAWELDTPDRIAYLDRACADDLALRSEVESLLASDALAGEFLAAPAVDLERAIEQFPSVPEANAGLTGSRIGRYTLHALIGKGGMGAVYRGVREDDFRMQVAIKLLKRGTDTETALSRFRAERQILAGLQHPNIARLLDGGATEAGLPYFVMEYVDGTPLLEYAAPLPVRRRLRVVPRRMSGGAVRPPESDRASGHQAGEHSGDARRNSEAAGFRHREAARPGPAAVDHGAHQRGWAPDDAELRESGAGTRRAGNPGDGHLSSLGAVLYELLTGRRAHTLEARSREEIHHQVCIREPLRPTAITKGLDPDLDKIVLMALRKRAEDRYASVEELSADLDRFLHQLPVHARPESVTYRGRKFLTRNRIPATAALLGGVLVLGLVAGMERFGPSRAAAGARSIAVLPLQNLSGDREQEYFADGMTDALIGDLARLPALRVISRTSVMTFKGVQRPLPEIARRLGVRTIVEGSVLRSGNRLRIAVRLVDARTEHAIWSGSYEGELNEVLVLQSQVAGAIAGEIDNSLAASNKT